MAMEMSKKKATIIAAIVIMSFLIRRSHSHGPPPNEDAMSMMGARKVGQGVTNRWCSMAKSCHHDRVPMCGSAPTGELVGFRDLCDMFDYNCLRKKNFRQSACPDDKASLTVSRRPVSYYDD